MELGRKRKAIIVTVIALTVFGGSQYIAATGITVEVVSSELVSTSQEGSMYTLQISVNNPTLLPITVGQTEFAVSANNQIVGNGFFESFVMPIMGGKIINGSYLVNSNSSQDSQSVKIIGTTEYSLLFGSISLPFEYDTSDGFIHQL